MKDRNFSWLYSHNTPITKDQGTRKIITHLMSRKSNEMQEPTKPKSKKMILLHFSRKTQKPKAIEKINRKMKSVEEIYFNYYCNRIGYLEKNFKPKNTETFFSVLAFHCVSRTVVVHSVKNSRSQKYRTAKKMLLITLEYFCGYEIRWSTPLKIKYLICSYFVNFETRSLKWTI